MPDITMQKIAELAGVSRATVSRVLCDPDKVKPETRVRIRTIMDEFGYAYNAGAADLIKKRASIIGLIIPTVDSPAFSNTILAVQEAAIELGMSLLLGCASFDADREEALLRQFLARRVAGVVMLGHAGKNEELILTLQNSGIPSVVIWTTPSSPALCQAGFDNAAAAKLAVEHLINMGHRRIALLCGPLDGARRAFDRRTGYENALRAHGIPVNPQYIHSTIPNMDNGEDGCVALLNVSPRPTAIFAASDMLAIGCLSAARKAGLSVPRDLSVVGFDGIDFSAHTDPPLTTVAVPEKEMSRMAIHLLKQLINREITPPKSYCLETELIVRKSCAPPMAVDAVNAV